MHAAEHIEPGRAPAAPFQAARRRFVAFALVALAIVFSAELRIQVALRDPGFDAQEPRRLLWSDPALLYYFTEKIDEHGGSAPPELRADPSFEWPDRVDALAFETIGQEYVASAWHRWFGAGEPLHLSCLKSMAWAASLTAIGIALLAAELSGSALLGALAAVIAVLLPASYRTLGVLLIREDFALPWFALHLGLLARAARVRSKASFVLCGLVLVGALATWHAMGFIVAMEAAVVLLWFLRTGRNPFAVSGAWIVPAVVAAGSFAVPVLRAKMAVLSLPMQAAAGLLLAELVARRQAATSARSAGSARPWHAKLAALGGVVATATAAAMASRAFGGGIGDYSHVVRLLLAKVRFFGELPSDPRALDFEARLLWQGPFETNTLLGMVGGLTVGVPALVWLASVGARDWLRGSGRGERPVGTGGRADDPDRDRDRDERVTLLAAFGVVAWIAAWLVARTEVVVALVAPVAVALTIGKLRGRVAQVVLAGVTLAVAASMTTLFVVRHRIDWYSVPRNGPNGALTWIAHPRQNALPRLLAFLESKLPAGVPIAADMVTSTAILAHTRHPILLQPKYESRESRRRIEEFLVAFFRGSPAEFAALLQHYGCRHFALDTKTLGIGSLYLAGFKDDGSEPPPPGTAAAQFLAAPDPAKVPGFRLLWRSSNDPRTDLYRVYEVE